MIKKINNLNFPLAIFSIFSIFSILISLGHIDRWVVSEQVAMAENFIINNSFFPSPDQESIKGVSVYPPGLAIFSLVLLKLGLENYIFEILLASSIIFIFIFFLIYKFLYQEIFNYKVNNDDFLIYIILITTLLPRWYDYSLQLKPSILGQIFGLTILLLFIKNKKKNMIIYSFFLGFLYSLPIIFKQQYIAFIIGFTLFCLFSRSLKSIFFCLGSFLSLTILLTTLNLENLQYWNYEIFKDDGTTDLLLIFSEHYLVLLRMIFLVGFSLLAGFKFSEKIKVNINYIKQKCAENPIYFVSVSSFFAIYLGLYKAGGNDGNIEGGLIFLIPLFFYIFQNLNIRYLILFAFISVFSLLPKVYYSVQEYVNMNEFKEIVEILDIPSDIKIVIDSNTYYASRVIETKDSVDNYWSYSYTIPGRGSPNLETYIKDKLDDQKFVLIIESTELNRSLVTTLGLNLIFENNSGIIAFSK